MKMIELKDKAKNLGIKPGKLRKLELIRTIQKTEGNYQCYGTAEGKCPNKNCSFYEDCKKTKKANITL